MPHIKPIILLFFLWFMPQYHGSFAASSSPVAELPVWEFPSSGSSDYFVVLFSGDGGWKPIMESISNYFKARKVPIVILNIQRYLWTEKTPSQIARDLETMIDSYSHKWGKQNVVLMGYSMGADILPFGINGMIPAYLSRAKDIILIAPSQKTIFKIKLLSYVYDDNEGVDVFPEIRKLQSKPLYCICDDKKTSICKLGLDGIASYTVLTGGHHFDGDYSSLTKLIGKRLKMQY